MVLNWSSAFESFNYVTLIYFIHLFYLYPRCPPEFNPSGWTNVLSCHNFFDRTTPNFVRLSSHRYYAKPTSAQRRCKWNVKKSIFNYSETFTLIILIVKPAGYACKLLTPWLAQSCEYKCRYNACLKSVTRYSISTAIINVRVATNRTVITEILDRIFSRNSSEGAIKVTCAERIGTISVNSQLLLPTNRPPFLSGLLVFKRDAPTKPLTTMTKAGCLFRNRLISSKKRISDNYADDGDVIRSGDGQRRVTLILLPRH